MTQGPSHPDETPDEGEQRPNKTESFGLWEPTAGDTAPTSPPRGSFAPIEGTIPGFGSLVPSEPDSLDRPNTDHPSDESIGIHGALQPGQTLFGRYLAEKLLGEGGMGTVWLVKHLELDTLRALKLIVSGIAFDPQAQARFKREARVMARLSHPHAVLVHDARMGRDAAFIEMEYIRGQSLNKAMSPGMPMPLDWIARILEQLCDVLQEAHQQQIVHRDLKPANLMLLEGRPVGREHLKVLDFGIAKILGGDSDAADVHTHTGSFLGSAPYTSPEQASGGTIDGRSDIYSVGIILYEMMTGYRPFTGPITRLIYDHLYSAPPPFAERNPNCRVPAQVEHVVLRCLAKNPDDRPQSAHELWEEFRNAIPPGLQPDQGALPLPRTERDHPVVRPQRHPSDDAGTNHTQGLTEDALRVPYHPTGTEPVRTQAFGTPSLAKANGSSGLNATDWGHQTAVAEPAPRLRRRVGRGVLAVALLIGIGLGMFAFWRSRIAPPPGLPQGYRAEGSDSIHGLPKTLVRARDGVRFSLIEGGTFKMGNDNFVRAEKNGYDEDQPAHPVTLSDFWLQEKEVTNGELEAYFVANHVPLAERPKRWQTAWNRIEQAGGDPRLYPATGISHDLAETYAHSVGGRLPTEAQWEYAARSRGKPIPYVWGAAPKLDNKRANVDSVGQLPIPVERGGSRRFDKTDQGIVDMTGNVREWCRDVWAPYSASPTPLQNPTGPPVPKSGPVEYVMRGGSFTIWADRVRTTRPRRPAEDEGATTSELAEDQTAEDLGFRVVLERPQP